MHAVQFLSENHLNRCQISGRFSFLKTNPNRISVFRTSLVDTSCACLWMMTYYEPVYQFLTGYLHNVHVLSLS